jgi:hypothetical protein
MMSKPAIAVQFTNTNGGCSGLFGTHHFISFGINEMK